MKTRSAESGRRQSGTGVVKHCVESHAGKAPANPFNTSRLIAALRSGLPIGELEALQTGLDIPMEKLAPMLGMSKATLHRRKKEGSLDPAESDRVVRYARLLGQAIEALEDEDSARQWLRSAQVGLGGAVPLEYAQTEVGAREVEDLLGRIEHGVYS